MSLTEKKPAPPRRRSFVGQFGTNIVAALVLISVSLTVGTLGYHHYAHMTWVNAFTNAAMMVTSMGPLDPLNSEGARLFGAFFALYSGFALAATTGLIIAPLIHSFVDRLHVRRDED